MIQHVAQIFMIILLMQWCQYELIWLMNHKKNKIVVYVSRICPQCDTESVILNLLCSRLEAKVIDFEGCTFRYFQLQSYYIHYYQSINSYMRLYTACFCSGQCWITCIELFSCYCLLWSVRVSSGQLLFLVFCLVLCFSHFFCS